LADRVARPPLIIWGMIVQALALGVIGFGFPSTYASGVTGAVVLGLGTAMAYPALLATAADISPAAKRATTLGWYRFWRDLGYPAGALLAGFISSVFGLVWAVYLASLLTFMSGIAAASSMRTTRLRESANPPQRRSAIDIKAMSSEMLDQHQVIDGGIDSGIKDGASVGRRGHPVPDVAETARYRRRPL
jgi:MFS family permease